MNQVTITVTTDSGTFLAVVVTISGVPGPVTPPVIT